MSLNGSDRTPQIVLQVPPEVIRLLTGILSSLQRLEAEVRDVGKRLEWARPAAAPERPSLRIVGPSPDVRDDLREMAAERTPAPKHRLYRSTHTPAGPVAARRMKALQGALGTSGAGLARKLGIPQTTVSQVSRGALGISMKVHEAMVKLEAKA